MFSQEVEILVFAVHGEDKDSITEGGSCVFSKGKLLFKEGEKEQTETVWGDILPRGRRKYVVSQLRLITLKRLRKRKNNSEEGNPKPVEVKCTHQG